MKRIRVLSIITAVLLLCVSCFAFPASAVPAPLDYLFGDIDFNDKLSVSDATLIQKSVAEMTELNYVQTILADFNHDGVVSVADATAVQQSVAGMELPEGCGGYMYADIHIYDFYSDYLSGAAAKGTPITFTAKAADPYNIITYEFLINGEVVQPRGDSNTLVYTFEEAGSYRVQARAYNKWGYYYSDSLNFSVPDSVDEDELRIVKSRVYSNYTGYHSTVEAAGGTAPYTYSLKLENEPSGLDYYDIRQYKYYTEYHSTNWKLMYDENNRAYLYRDFSDNPEELIPEDLLIGDWYTLTVQVKDANGTLSKEISIDAPINLIG